MSGFEYALSLDIDAIELDIQLHRGELWVIHDHDLERLTGATLDRLTHRCHILECNGDSYRLRESQRRLKQRATTRTRRHTS